jgi:predicted phosphodiesterase
MCEPIVIPEPDDNQTTEEPPAPSNETAKIIGVGDVECSGDGIKVLNQIKKENPNLALILGDLCYDSSTSNFLSTWGTLGNQLACMIGNHDAEEDGSAALYQAFLEYCGNDYFIKNANYLIQGLNTNDNTAGLQSQSQQFTARLKNATFMEGIDVVIVASHKPICETPPNSHHPIDEDSKSKAVNEAFCEPIKEAVNPTVKLIFLNGHNHIMASGQQNGISYVESGAGGKSHYECGTNNIFTFCNNTKFGYWMIEIEPDGTIQSGFKDINGGMVN